MKTPEEIKELKEGLKCCSSDECHGEHSDCPYKNNVFCMMTMAGEAMAYIEQLEERISLMLIQMQGDCGCCKHVTVGIGTEPCASCLHKRDHDAWEYRGLPGDERSKDAQMRHVQVLQSYWRYKAMPMRGLHPGRDVREVVTRRHERCTGRGWRDINRPGALAPGLS